MIEQAALVTGGSRGIGLGIAQALLADGHRVAVNGVRSDDEVADTMEALAELGEVVYVRGDVGDPDDRTRIVAETVEGLGGIEVLVNNAGITSPGRNDMLDVEEEDFDRVVAVNLKGPFLLTQAVARHMIEQRESHPDLRGCVVNVSSISAVLVSTNRSEYCISKAGISMATKLWATRLAEHRIDVYEVQPGVIKSDMTAGVTEKYDALIEQGLTLERRWGTPEDVGAVVATVVRGDLPYATGQVLTIDGGLTVPRL